MDQAPAAAGVAAAVLSALQAIFRGFYFKYFFCHGHTLTDTDRNVGMLEVQEVIIPERRLGAWGRATLTYCF